jgi:hypothetical protein
MGPPYMSYSHHLPQPVEIDPVSYPKNSGPYPSWDSYPVGPLGEPSSPFSHSANTNKTVDADLGSRSGSQDPLTAWYTANDGPWTGIAKAAVSEIGPDQRMHSRNYQLGPRTTGYGPSSGTPHRPGNLSDLTSAQFAVPHSDSGYDSRRSLENASVRSTEVVDQNLDTRSLTGRALEFHSYLEGTFKEQTQAEIWSATQPNAPLPTVSQLFCDFCQKYVKTKSELKYSVQHRTRSR